MNHIEDRILRLEARQEVLTFAIQATIGAVSRIDRQSAQLTVETLRAMAAGYREVNQMLAATFADQIVGDLSATL